MIIKPLLLKNINKIFDSNIFKHSKKFERKLTNEDLINKGEIKVSEKSSLFQNDTIKNFDEIVEIERNISFISGWVPYLKNRTSLIIYNFLSNNYSIRKNLILKFSILNNHKLNFLKFKTLKQYEIIELNENFFNKNNNSDGILVVQIYSPFIEKFYHPYKKNEINQFRFWVRYKNNNNQVTSTVHSLPLNKLKYEKKKMYSRNYFPFTKNNINLNFSLDQSNPKKNNTHLCSGGYNIITDKENNPISVWHLGPSINKNILNNKINKFQQCFWVPKNKYLNPKIRLDISETFLKEEEYQNLNLKIIKNEKIIEDKKFNFKGNFEKNISDIFNFDMKSEYIVFLEFESRILSYAQVTYDSKNTGDQVHTHAANYFINQENKIKSSIIFDRQNSRKFMHLNMSNENFKNYLILHNRKVKNIHSKTLKIRYLDNDNNEIVKKFLLDDSRILYIFDINKIFFENIDYKNINCALIQIESGDANFDATMLSHHINEDIISTDHLTGG